MVALRTEDEMVDVAQPPPAVNLPTRVAQPSPAVSRPPVRLRTTWTAPLPLVRRDMLPENAAYPDTGCDLFASCLRCPLARCRFDEPPGGLRRLMIETRDREIALIRRRHRAPINALAQTYGLTRRSIFRILSEQRRVGRHASATREADDRSPTVGADPRVRPPRSAPTSNSTRRPQCPTPPPPSPSRSARWTPTASAATPRTSRSTPATSGPHR